MQKMYVLFTFVYTLNLRRYEVTKVSILYFFLKSLVQRFTFMILTFIK